MDILFQAPCWVGKFIVYKDRVSIELKGFGVHNTNSIAINQITGVKVHTKVPSLGFMSKGLEEIIVTGNSSQQLKATIADLSKAKQAEALIYSLISSN